MLQDKLKIHVLIQVQCYQSDELIVWNPTILVRDFYNIVMSGILIIKFLHRSYFFIEETNISYDMA